MGKMEMIYGGRKIKKGSLSTVGVREGYRAFAWWPFSIMMVH